MKNIKNSLAWLIATCGGMGKFPVGPGTFTSLVSIFFWIGLKNLGVSLEIQFSIIVFLTLAGVYAARIHQAVTNTKDASEIVIDEWVGMGIALFLAPPDIIWVGLGFVLFRIFDIWKPPGVKFFDDRNLNGWGVILDDVVAGIYAAILMAVGVRYFYA